MATYKCDRTNGTSLELNIASSDKVSESTHEDTGSQKKHGLSPPEPSPHFPKTYGSGSPASSTTGPGSDFGPLSPDVADLVYPIRSVVNISYPLQSGPVPPNNLWGSGDSTTGSTAGRVPLTGEGLVIQSRNRSESPPDPLGQSRQASLVSVKDMCDGASEKGNPLPKRGSMSTGAIVESLAAGSDEETTEDRGTLFSGRINQLTVNIEGEGFITARFKHKMTKDGHAVVTGVSGAESLQRCEDEPIHIPGAVQGFGVLIAFQEDPSGGLNVKIASENSELIIGYSPAALFALNDFCNILSEEQAENLYEHLDFIRDDTSDLLSSGPEVFPLVITAPDSTRIKLWCAIHISDNNPDLLVCELELEDDQLFPLFNPADGNDSPPFPEDTLGSSPSEQELLESTMSMSRPLRVLRRARKRRGQAATMEVFNLMSQIQDQISSATNLDTSLKVAVGIVKELTGFHRVMIYQFDENWNGRVVTELVDPRATKDLYKGLNFPASDIPKQARDLYRINKVRLLYDRDQETARLVCKSKEYLDRPLDMTHSYLRAMSPIHIKYLKNMAVRASMSISITAFDELWGLVSCHTYGQKGMRVSFPIRKMCRLIGETMSRNIERLSYASRLQARKLINTVPTEQNPGGYIIASSDDLLKLFDADFGLLSIREETKVLGELEHSQEALALVEYLRIRVFTSIVTSQDLAVDFPDLDYAPGFSEIAGLLLVPLSIGGHDFIVFFRKGQLRQVNWAGNPYEKVLREGTQGYLEPRKSFRIWSETVAGKSREWTEEQIETAAVLCLVYGKFIEVWRQKEAALQKSQLTKLLLANASHEVRTPLNAIINYLEIALESPLDSETRDNLMRSHTASKSLIYVINDLLDLTRTEEGQDLVMEEIFDLPNTVHEATSIFRSDTERKSISLEIIEYPGLPKFVKGDQSRLRQALSNITGNAIKYTNQGGIKIEIWMPQAQDDRCQIEIAIQDTGVGISAKKLDMLFREFEQVQTEDDQEVGTSTGLESSPHKLHAGRSFDGLSKIPGQKMLGLGLAVVARTIKNMDGQLRLKSEEGRGSRFTISLPFMLPSEKEETKLDFQPLATREPSPPQSMTPPLEQDPKELLLIDSSSQKRSSMATERKNSSGSLKSLGSQNSERSEIDRLVHAISSPHLSPSPSENPTTLRSNTSKTLPPKTGILGLGSPSPSGPLFLSAPQSQPGQEVIEGSAVPLRAVRMPDEGPPTPSSEILPNIPMAQPAVKAPDQTEPMKGSPGRFKVLVAEDDPINSKIIKKRMEKLGHEVSLTVNGAECADTFMKNGEEYDIVLMDMQMPIMDGGTSTTQIRGLEASNNIRGIPLKHRSNGRIPIFAVSASLVEERCQEYMDLGFDGWILKPVDFKRLQVLMDGILQLDVRKGTAYQLGEWERGGWFLGPPGDPIGSNLNPDVSPQP